MTQRTDTTGPARPRQWWVPYAVGIAALLIAVVAAHYAGKAAAARDELRFQRAVLGTREAIEQRMAAYVAMLRAGAGLFAATGVVSREQFAAYVERLDLAHQYPGIQGIGVSLRAPTRAALIHRLRRAGFREVGIWPEGPRADYHGIVYLEPLDRRNRAALGYDMFTDAVRRAAMERARDTGAPAASARVTLVQEIDTGKQPGFLIYMPIYRGGRPPASVEARRAALLGFVYGPFRAGDLLEGVVGVGGPAFVHVAVYDGPVANPEGLLYRSDLASGRDPAFSATHGLSVAGRAWTLRFDARAGEFSRTSPVAIVILVAGVLLSALLFATTRSLLAGRETARELARERLESEQRFRQLADAAPVLVWASGPDKAFTFFNTGWLQFTGRAPVQELGDGWVTGVHPDDRERWLARYGTAFDAREPFEIEYRLRRADGAFRWIVARGVPRYDVDGAFTGYIGACIDIDDRKQADADRERALGRERQARMEAEALAAAGRALTQTLDVDRVGRIIVDTAKALTGLQAAVLYRIASPAGDLVVVAAAGETGPALVAGMTLPSATGAVGRAVSERRVVSTRNFVDDPSVPFAPGARDALAQAPYRAVLALPLISHDRLVGALALGDAADREFSEAEIALAESLAREAAVAFENAQLFADAAEARTHAEAANRTKDEFLATLSHELRTPLNAILGWARMLASSGIDREMTARALDSVQRNAVALAQLVDDLLDVARITSGKLRLDVRPLDVAAVAEAAVDTVRPAAHAKGIRLTTALAREPGTVLGDADRLQQVVWNLLTNAIKFTPGGGHVDVRVGRVDAEVEIVVSDTGQGLAPQLLPYVFDRFRQGDSSSTRTHQGLGIGLALVRHLVELHGGQVSAASPGKDQGATFTVRLPARAPDDARALDGAPPQGRRFDLDVDTPSLAGLGVLAVDDDRDSLQLLGHVLAKAGATVRAAASASEAMTLLESWRPDVILSDIEMPGEDGHALIRRIRALPTERGGAAPAIAVTAYGRMEDRIRSLAAGYQQHLSKPVEPTELVAVIASLARRGG